MNQEQLKSTVRSLLATFGGLFAGWVAAKGYASKETILSLVQNEAFLGVITSAAVMVWGLIRHKQVNQVAAVDAIAKEPDSPVKAVVMEATPEGKAIAGDLPGNTTVVAGTPAATAVSKSA